MKTKLRKRITISFPEKSITDQSMKNAVDINKIVASMQRGQAPQLTENGFYGDVSDLPSLSDALMTVMQAQQNFEKLPPDLRQLVSNDWTKVDELFTNPDHAPALEKYRVKEAPALPPAMPNKNDDLTTKSKATLETPAGATGTPS